MRKRAAFLALAIVLVLVGSVVYYLGLKLYARHLSVGRPVPSIPVIALNGEASMLRTTGERCTVLIFFKASCQHCQQTLSTMNRLFGSLKDTLSFTAVSFSGIHATRQLIRGTGMAVPVVVADEKYAGDPFSINGFPTVYYVDTKGILLYRRTGERSYNAERQLLMDVVLNHPRQEFHEIPR